MRLGKIQRMVMAYVARTGSIMPSAIRTTTHEFSGSLSEREPLERAIAGLVKRGILRKVSHRYEPTKETP
jgi:hypothetical protein